MYCEKCGTKLPDVARYCENCGTAVSYVKGVSLRSDDAVLRERTADERKTVYSTSSSVWILAILVAVGSVVYLFLQKWIGLNPAVASQLNVDADAMRSIGLFDLYNGFKAMEPMLSSYDANGGVAIAGTIVTALAAVNLVCIVSSGLSAIMLLVKKNKASRGFSVLSLVLYALLAVAVFVLVYYGNQEIGKAASMNILEVDMMVYIGFIPMIASVVLSNMSCKKG